MASDQIYDLRDTERFTLKAMATNYADGHRWDKLDGEAVTKAAAEIDALRTALAVERERAEKAERELDLAQVVISEWGYTKERAEAAEASLAEAKRLLKVFADVAEQDIDEIEKDADRFVPMRTYNKAPLLTVGDLRAAARFLAQEEGRPTEEPQR